jgi:beta-xylosidase
VEKTSDIFTGWAYPPKDYARFAELVHQWVRHSIERYGRDQVETWLWEVWNEPNIGYWKGTPEEYHKLYDYSVDAVKRALPSARVGGPHSTGPRERESPRVPARLSRALRSREELRHGRPPAPRSTSSGSTPRAAPKWSTGTCGWGSRAS